MLEYKTKLMAPGPRDNDEPLSCPYIPVDYTTRNMLAVLRLNNIAIWDNSNDPLRLPADDWNHVSFRRPLGLSMKPKLLKTQNMMKKTSSGQSSAASSSGATSSYPSEWMGGNQPKTGQKRSSSSVEDKGGKGPGKRARTTSPSRRWGNPPTPGHVPQVCLLYTSDAADDP